MASDILNKTELLVTNTANAPKYLMHVTTFSAHCIDNRVKYSNDDFFQLSFDIYYIFVVKKLTILERNQIFFLPCTFIFRSKIAAYIFKVLTRDEIKDEDALKIASKGRFWGINFQKKF